MPGMPAVLSPAGRPWVAEDLDEMPEDGYRREVIDGVLIVSPSPVGRHQNCVVRLTVQLDMAAPAQLKVMVAPYDWRPATRESFQPDLMVIRRPDYDPDGLQRATPILVIEVLSPSSIQHDRAVKRAAYERLEVPAYWIVDPAAPGVTVLGLNRRNRYREVTRATGDQCLAVDFPFPVQLIPGDLIT